MADDFLDFFIGKIQTIRDEISSADEFKPQVNNIPQLNQFTPLKIEGVQKEIILMKSKSCNLDTIPTNLLKELLPILHWNNNTHSQCITNKENLCQQLQDSNSAPPVVKKHGLDLLMKNYRPVFNLCILSKLVKHCMFKQLINHCNTNCLIPYYQSAYRENCSTETSLIQMCNDILWSMEKQQITDGHP